MTAYTLTVTLHVLIAVLGVGQISTIGVVAAVGNPSSLPLVRKLSRAVNGSLVGMLLTGIGSEWVIHFADEPKLWFRAAFVLLILIGAAAGYLGRVARTSTDASPAVLRKIRFGTLAASALVATAVVVMVLKPI